MLADTIALANGTYTKLQPGNYEGVETQYTLTVANYGIASIVVRHERPTKASGTVRDFVQIKYPAQDPTDTFTSGKFVSLNFTITYPNDGVNSYALAAANGMVDMIKLLSNGTAVSSNFTAFRSGAF